MSAEPIITELGEHGDDREWVSLKVECGMCSHVTFTSRLRKFMPTASDILLNHLRQHEPGRALDIDVDWVPRATCSVCESGGDIVANDIETLICNECDTVWSLDGTDGERDDDA